MAHDIHPLPRGQAARASNNLSITSAIAALATLVLGALAAYGHLVHPTEFSLHWDGRLAERHTGEFGAVKIVSGNITGRTQTATLVVEAKYQNFQQQTAYATSFLLIFVSIACLVVVALLRPKHTP